MTYQSTKTFPHETGLSCAFRQWRADSHCRYLHGYALAVTLTFEAETLDGNNWVMDFGSFKPVKEWLAEHFDHKTVVAVDDPELDHFKRLDADGIIELVVVMATGCEAFANMIYNHVHEWMMETGAADRVKLVSVEVREHGANSSIYVAPWVRAQHTRLSDMVFGDEGNSD